MCEGIQEEKKKGWVVELALEKVFDRTDWDFLDSIMARKGFVSRWRRWREGCLSSSHFAIMINGIP